jgi:hypothetical protein
MLVNVGNSSNKKTRHRAMLTTAFIIKPLPSFSCGISKQFLMLKVIQSQIIERLHHIIINLEVYFRKNLTCFMQALPVAS